MQKYQIHYKGLFGFVNLNVMSTIYVRVRIETPPPYYGPPPRCDRYLPCRDSKTKLLSVKVHMLLLVNT